MVTLEETQETSGVGDFGGDTGDFGGGDDYGDYGGGDDYGGDFDDLDDILDDIDDTLGDIEKSRNVIIEIKYN